jgi:hypothetical protein
MVESTANENLNQEPVVSQPAVDVEMSEQPIPDEAKP